MTLPISSPTLPAPQPDWDRLAASFDDEPDHGLRDPAILAAWTKLFAAWLPAPRRTVLDAGCGTGSLSLLLAGLGHTVTGIDLSPAMVARAQAKALAAGLPVAFQVMNAAAPEFTPRHFDALVCRHVLWALPDWPQALGRWVALLKPGGRLILIEGCWSTGAGLHAAELLAALPPALVNVQPCDLSQSALYWGREISDERYAIVADCPQPHRAERVSAGPVDEDPGH